MNATAIEQSLTLHLIEKPTSEIVRFLEQTVWGSSGLQYYAKYYDQALLRIPNPRFFALRDAGTIIGCVMFFVKPVSLGMRVVKIAYLTQLSVLPQWRGQGLAGRLVNAVTRHIQAITPEPTGVTAYIDEANTPSLTVFRGQGFTDLGSFHGIVINRIHPKPCLRAESLPEKDFTSTVNTLTALYAGHILQDFETSLHPHEYRVIRDEEGNLIAGLQAHPEVWKVTHLEGLSGWLVIHGLSKIRWVRDHLFNPEVSRFLHIGNLYAKPGQEHYIFALIEDALVRARVPFAVAYLDKRSPVYQRLAAAESFGILNHEMETPVRVMSWFQGLTEAELIAARQQPLSISPLDIS